MRPNPESVVTGELSRKPSFLLPHASSARDGTQHRAPAQVNHISKCVYSVVLFVLLVSKCVAYPDPSPRIDAPDDNKPGAVYFKTRYCRPVSDEELQKRMGAHFDSTKMASHPDLLRRSHSSGAVDNSEEDYSEDEDFDEYMQGDDPGAYNLEEDEDDFEDDHDEDDEEDDDFVEGKSEEVVGTEFKDKRPVYNFMRRRRRDVADDTSENRDIPHQNSYSSKRGLKGRDDEATLHQKLLLSQRKSKARRLGDKSRKQLKKELREKIRKSNKKPPWECRMDRDFKEMRAGIFPRYVYDGVCVQKKCFYKLYNCVEKKYKIRLLERDPDQCIPVPLVGLNTTYEEKWYFTPYYVTVGCNCERRKSKKRRRT